MEACIHSINPVLLPINMCTSPYPGMYIKFNDATIINEYQDNNCTTVTSHFSLDTNICHYMALSNSAIVLYTTDNYTVTKATVNPNYSSGTIKKINEHLLIIVIIFIILINY
jgi:hypothetical protein